MAETNKGKKKKMIPCPWGCKEKISRKDYSEHLMTVHYKKEGEKLMGPFPAGVK